MDERSTSLAAVERLADGDLVSVYKLCSEEERRALGLSEDAVRRIEQRLVTPYVQAIKHSGKVQTDWMAPMASAISSQEFVTLNGQTGRIAFQVDRNPEGAFASFTAAIFECWELREAVERENPSLQPLGGPSLLVAALERDRPFFESIGFTGFFNQKTKRIWTWDEARMYWLELEELRRDNERD
ncbi:MAG: hypothetical protein KIT11_06755 [Fimbriimonadaceae bacterium]|nr:hypothetical protein [Fimbriimonadaceae bacterium]QYK56053.1 MAG: hypothetical protein KF733_00945 [Fimbriimonadaceae bacterium]